MRKLLESYKERALESLVPSDAMVFQMHDVVHAKEVTKETVNRLKEVQQKLQAAMLIVEFIADVQYQHSQCKIRLESAPTNWGKEIQNPSDLQFGAHIREMIDLSIQRLEDAIKD